MAKKTLLLDASYQVQQFIDFRKALKHIIKDKVEVISTWDDDIIFGSGRMKHPAILRLKNPIKIKCDVIGRSSANGGSIMMRESVANLSQWPYVHIRSICIIPDKIRIKIIYIKRRSINTHKVL